jgi:hypothetical protein
MIGAPKAKEKGLLPKTRGGAVGGYPGSMRSG